MAPASSNWQALQKRLRPNTHSHHDSHPRKRRKLDERAMQPPRRSSSPATTATTTKTREKNEDFVRGSSKHIPPQSGDTDDSNAGVLDSTSDTVPSLRAMVLGKLPIPEAHTSPGKYIALDCEMVGIGLGGTESSLARVSIVNFYGHVLLDDIVQQKEKVVDFRTRWSGIRPGDMLKAKPFDIVQKQVADLLSDRILIGHALHNDLKALLLSHPRPQTRDTQICAYKYKLTKSKYVALRLLVKQELDMTIQEGEHSSVIDARATMAIFRLHKKVWERGAEMASSRADRRKRKRDQGSQPSSSTRRGISSGLSTIVKVRTKPGNEEWWKKL